MMWPLLALLLISFHQLQAQTSLPKNGEGLMVTTPQSWLTGSDVTICVTSRVKVSSLNVFIKLNKQSNETVLVKEMSINTGETKCENILVSTSWDFDSANLVVTASDTSLPYKFEKSTTIYVKSTSDVMIFVQTDKPVYKPSDTVKVRTLVVKGPNLLPVSDMINLAYVQDAQKTRVMQWANVSTESGIGSLEMALSSEPPLGIWTLTVMVGKLEGSVSFEVKEYVLPKFSVNIVSDANIYTRAHNFKWKVCAEYTYGEPVSGTVLAHPCLKTYHWRSPALNCLFKNNKTVALKKGCAEFDTNLKELLKGETPRYMYGREITLKALVEESGTGVKQNTSKDLKFSNEEFKVDLKLSPTYYKPGLIYYGKGKVTDNNEEPAADKVIEITVDNNHYQREHIQKINFTSTTNAEGIFHFNLSEWFTRSLQKTSFYIKAEVSRDPHDKEDRYTSPHTVQPWYSASDSYLRIKQNEMSMESCALPSEISFIYRSKQALPDTSKFFYQITSHGDIVSSSSVDVIPGVVEKFDDAYTYHLTVATKMPDKRTVIRGNVNLVVFYIRPDGEMIADSATTSFDHCLSNKVKASFSKSKVQPGHTVSLDVATDPDSLCSLVVVDKSIKIMGAKYLSKADVQNKIKERYEASVKHKYVPYWENDDTCVPSDDDDSIHPRPPGPPAPMPRRPRRSYMPMRSDYLDSQKPFEDLGLVVLTDLQLVTRPCAPRHIRLYGMPGPGARGGGDYDFDEFDDRSLLAERVEAPPMNVPVYDTVKGEGATDKSPTLHRTYFPETWLWDLRPTGSSGHLKLDVDLPHTITDWIGNGFCVNPNSGLGLAPEFSVTAFQPFFVSFTLPYSMVRGEQVAIPVSVFNYLNECLKVTLTIERSDAYTVVNNTYRERLKVCGQQTEVFTFYLIPEELGKINLTVKAVSTGTSKKRSNSDGTNVEDIITREILVEAEGKPEEISKGEFVCGSGGGEWVFDLPTDIVSDSVKSQLSVIGDVMGSALSGIDSMLSLPMGCGEQNMLLFAPNIYVLQYLTKTQRLTADIKKKALSFMQTGYQRELTFRHTDGSYSAFGNSDPEGSIWLTAFVIKSFAQAKPYMFIDDNDLKVSIEWMIKSQLENGCFPQIGKVLHKDMTGGVEGSNTASLTAYILVALLEAGVSKEEPVIQNGLQCLHMTTVEDTYTLALLAYTYSVLGEESTERSAVVDKLETRAIVKDGTKHWEAETKKESTDSYHHAASADVELTSYILLSQLQAADMSVIPQLTPIVRWLSNQRNSHGGFASTQDTVLALQSLAQYAGLVYNDAIHLQVNMASNGETYKFNIDQDNSLLLQSKEDLPQHGRVHYSVDGVGCALLQASVRYNRLSLNEGEAPNFVLDVNVEGGNDGKETCRQRDINICASYNGSDEKTNMAVMAIKMVSGWVPDKMSVEKLKNMVELKLKRFEVDKNTLQLYFDEFEKREICFTISVEQEQQVEDAKPAIVHIYDYYDPSAKAYTDYSINNTCPRLRSRSVGDMPRAEPLTGNKKKEKNKDKGKNKKDKCPSCYSSLTDSSAIDTFCGAKFIYKVDVRKGKGIKMLDYVRYSARSTPPSNGKFKYRLSRKCQCDILTPGAQVLIASNNKLKEKNNKWILKLKNDAVVTSTNFDSAVNCPISD